MSGIVGSKLNIRGSGRIAKLGTDGQVLTSAGAGLQANYEDVAAGISWQAIETGSTMTAVAGNGYWIDTTSNACTITLPSSASNGDEIIFADYDRTWGTNGIELDSNGLNYQGEDDTNTVEYDTDGQAVHIVYSGATNGWIPILDEDVEDAPVAPTKAVYAYGYTDANTNLSNLVSSAGVVASDTAGVGTARNRTVGANYGGDKGLFFGGSAGPRTGVTNLVTNVGVIGTDVTAVGTARSGMAGPGYGTNLAVLAYGHTGLAYTAIRNLISSSGVVASDTTVAGGTGRNSTSGARYGTGTAIIAYGATGSANLNVSNLVSDVGAVSADVSGVGDIAYGRASAEYGGDKCFFAYGWQSSVESVKNLVSNSGVVAANVTGVGTARGFPSGASLGSRQTAIVIGGQPPSGGVTGISNLVSNVGVVASDTAGVATARKEAGATEFG